MDERYIAAENTYTQQNYFIRDNLMLHDKVKMLQRHLAWYRYKVTVLKEENEHLREKLARYRELERVLNGGK